MLSRKFKFSSIYNYKLKSNLFKFKIANHTDELQKIVNDFKEKAQSMSREEFSDQQQNKNENLKRFDVFRFDPEAEVLTKKLVSYYIDLKDCGPMVLDALIKIKDEVDPTLTFRRSCREGICGSCSMNIDGRNTLACLSYIDTDITRPSIIVPLPYFSVIRDLVVDMTTFYIQYKAINPVLMRKHPKVNFTFLYKETWTKGILPKRGR
jgi:hypothetical protein